MLLNPISNIERYIYLTLVLVMFAVAVNYKIGKDMLQNSNTVFYNDLGNIRNSMKEMEDMNISQDSIILKQVNEIKNKELSVRIALEEGSITKEQADKQISQLKIQIEKIKTIAIQNTRKELVSLQSQLMNANGITDTFKITQYKEVLKYAMPKGVLDSMQRLYQQKITILQNQNQELSNRLRNSELKISQLNSSISDLNEQKGKMALKKIEIKDINFQFVRYDKSTEKSINIDKGRTVDKVKVGYKVSRFSTVDANKQYEIKMKYFTPDGKELISAQRTESIMFGGGDSPEKMIEFKNIYGFKSGKHIVRFYDDTGFIAESSFFVTTYD